MDSYEATNIVFSRIQAIDPENASKITGYVLIQEHGEKEMIRLAFGPETLLQSLIIKAKSHLCISSNTSSTTLNPILAVNSHRLGSNLSVTVPTSPSTWHAFPVFTPNNSVSPSSPSYASSVVNERTNGVTKDACYAGNGNSPAYDAEYNLQDHLAFLNAPSSLNNGCDFLPYRLNSPTYNFHKRSPSMNDSCYVSDDFSSGVGWKPCLYFARGFCKNGSVCKFLHGGSFGESLNSPGSIVGPTSPFHTSHDMFCPKSLLTAHHPKRIAPDSSYSHNKSINFLMTDTHKSAAAALMMGEEFHKMGGYRSERNDFSSMMSIGGSVNPGSRQIYLTFPAESTFREVDVSNYFSMYGPVQDVRIPYQQKRMFGFVTFVYADTVKHILAKGNPHFVCDSRVLVKPYKEKGKIPEKKHLDTCDFACLSPTGVDSRERYDFHLARMFHNTQDMLRRKMEEQADLQQAIELQGRRLMNLQLMDMKKLHHDQYHPPSITAVVSPTQLQSNGTQSIPSDSGKVQQEANAARNYGNSQEEGSNVEECDIYESNLEHILPDSLFGSPKQSSGDGEHVFVFSTDSGGNYEMKECCSSSNKNNPLIGGATSTLTMAAKNSCSFHMPRCGV